MIIDKTNDHCYGYLMTAFKESGPYSIFKQCADKILHCIIRHSVLDYMTSIVRSYAAISNVSEPSALSFAKFEL